jgi:diguanylate cyclase (GGDEF)-like protein
MAYKNLFMENVTLRREIDRQRYRAISDVLAAINKVQSVEGAMQAIIDQICIQTGWSVGHAYVVDEVSGRDLVSSPAWHLEDPKKFEVFRNLSEATRLPAESDLPGQVLATGKSVWVDDFSQEFDFPRANLVRELGLRVGFAFPVLVAERVVAVMEFFTEGPVQPSEHLQEAMISIGTQLGRILETERYEKKILRNVLSDPLTDLPNRAAFLQSLTRCLALARRHEDYRFGVLFLDLDRFKIPNDSLGHLIGDRLLVEIARRIQGCLRTTDIVARLGGDEYAILLDDIKHERDAIRAAERIQKKLQIPSTLDGREVFTSASIGIVFNTPDYERAEDLLRDADTAMYCAKAEGKGQYRIFDNSMHDHAVKLLQLEDDLRHAVGCKEFSLVYQPIVSLETARIVAFEALLRWRHPERGLLPPSEFIQLAEETEVITPITQWILEEACSEIRKWRTRIPVDSSLSVSVNLTSKYLERPNLLEELASVLSRNKLAPQRLTLEITERQLMQNAASLSEVLSRLHKMGINVSIDDFGTGYSSLSYLSSFRIRALKIDRSFVSKVRGDQKDSAIVHSIVSLGRNLGLDIIAEGIETAEQLDYLRELKCPYGQGYYFSGPMDRETAPASLTGAFSENREKKIRISRLRSFELFAGLPEADLAEIAQNCADLTILAGTAILEEGQLIRNICLMDKGSVSLHHREGEISQILGVLEGPAVLGGMAIVEPERTASAHVKALVDLRLLTLPIPFCISYLQRSPSFRKNLEQSIAEQSLL